MLYLIYMSRTGKPKLGLAMMRNNIFQDGSGWIEDRGWRRQEAGEDA
jgi:hypothetical protein